MASRFRRSIAAKSYGTAHLCIGISPSFVLSEANDWKDGVALSSRRRATACGITVGVGSSWTSSSAGGPAGGCGTGGGLLFGRAGTGGGDCFGGARPLLDHGADE